MIHVAFFENIAHAHAYQMSLQILVAQIKTLPCDRILWRVGPACSETARHGVFSHHRGVSLAVPHSMPRYLRSRRRRSTLRQIGTECSHTIAVYRWRSPTACHGTCGRDAAAQLPSAALVRTPTVRVCTPLSVDP